MNIFWYIFHRFYNGLRWFYVPSLSHYRQFKIRRKRIHRNLWKEKKYPLVD